MDERKLEQFATLSIVRIRFSNGFYTTSAFAEPFANSGALTYTCPNAYSNTNTHTNAHIFTYHANHIPG